MRVGVVFPQTEIGADAGAVRAYAEHVEASNFTHVLAYDHVVGADPSVHTGWGGPYDVDTTFHEPLVMFGFLAGVTTTIELVTGVIILPQRQTALVAKQAAEVDLLSNGRLRLGVGIGWNAIEYEALGEDFTNRGKRSEEQIELMRSLWTQRSVTFSGRFHRLTGAGLAPLPVQRPIPVWIGAASARGFERAGRLADGGSRWSRPDRISKQHGRLSSGPRSKRVGIRPPSAWKGASAGGATVSRWRTKWSSGPTQAPPTCQSTP